LVIKKYVWKHGANRVLKNFKNFLFFLFKINFFIFLNYFNELIIKIIFKKIKKNYFYTFLNKKKHFKLSPITIPIMLDRLPDFSQNQILRQWFLDVDLAGRGYGKERDCEYDSTLHN
jgi:hypothetical protein